MSVPSSQEQQFLAHPKWPFLTLRSTFNSALAYKTHQHDTVSLGLVLDGTTKSTINGEEQTLYAGDMILIPHHCAHSCNPGGGSRSYHMLYMDKDWCIKLLGGNPEHHTFTTSQYVIHDQTHFTRMVDWLSCFQESSDKELDALVAIIEEFGALEPNASIDLDGIIQSELSIQELATAQGMSREGFIRAVKRKTGLSPLALRHNQRIEMAKKLISEGSALIDVALLVGYQDQSQFHKHFVHFTAATPKQFQRSLRLLNQTMSRDQ